MDADSQAQLRNVSHHQGHEVKLAWTPFAVVVNHRPEDVTLDFTGVELLTGERCPDGVQVPAGRVRVVRTEDV